MAIQLTRLEKIVKIEIYTQMPFLGNLVLVDS